jgi:hypothetical protein
MLGHWFLLVGCAAGVLFAVAEIGCTKPTDVHETAEARTRSCASCHQAAYLAATHPKHVGAMPQYCDACHSSTAWVPATTGHQWWPLVGKHVGVSCASCHSGDPAVYVGTPNDCVSCHKTDYDNATTPPHTGFATTCETCHTPQGWSPSTFSHPWPLEGAHAQASCASCHPGTPPRYAGTPTACVDCHQSEATTADANVSGHRSYARTCGDCHDTTAWSSTSGGGGAHPEAAFPITTGVHSLGIACADCHIAANGSAAGGANTDCIHCHLGAHPRSAMDSDPKHTGLSGYPGASAPVNFCLNCHPKGTL